jgi:hypothetical protein
MGAGVQLESRMAIEDSAQKKMPSEQDVSILSAFMSAGGRLPGFAQRRLDDLMERNKTGGLSAAEQRELSEALEYLDEKSIELLAYAAESQPMVPQSAPDPGGSPPPLWRGYIHARLKQLCAG